MNLRSRAPRVKIAVGAGFALIVGRSAVVVRRWRRLKRGVDLLLVLAVWAAIYLPWLGSPELRSEEGHRVLPAVEMLQSGDFLVPHIGGVPYLRKPPLINWIVAGAFKISGVRNEWAARLPSALAVLAVAIVSITVGANAFGAVASRVAAFAWLTSFGMIEKGRMIEIDAVFVSLFAIAFICWLAWWQERRSPWLTWIVPWIFLGLDLLAKGPAHLLYFYAAVVAILWRTRRLRELLHAAHIVGVLVMVSIFAAWAVPCFSAVTQGSISRTWGRELAMRLTGGENDATNWPMNFPSGVGYFLPWALLLPFVRISRVGDLELREIARGLFWGALIPFVVVLLLPGTIPRYILPTLVPAAWLLGIAVSTEAFAWNLSLGGRRWNVSPKWVVACVAMIGIGAAIAFPARSAVFLKNRPKVRPIAAMVNAAIPSGETLYALNPLFQPYLFYIEGPVRYVVKMDDLPEGARYFVMAPEEKLRAGATTRWKQAQPRFVLQTPAYRGHETLLFRIDPP